MRFNVSNPNGAKTNKEHIIMSAFTNLSVKLAVQVLSHSVPYIFFFLLILYQCKMDLMNEMIILTNFTNLPRLVSLGII